MDHDRRPQIPALRVQDRPRPPEHAQGDEGREGVVVGGEQDPAAQDGERVPELQDQRRQEEAPVQELLPPGSVDAGGDVPHH